MSNVTDTGYDFIGDIHGSRNKLEGLLAKLGYKVVTQPAFDSPVGTYAHPTRTAVFVGDLIDRGPNQLGVLQLVKAMADYGSAQVVMGNHELNALAYATPDPALPGEFCRVHKLSNQNQHAAFLDQLDAAEQRYYLEWIFRLPLWLDLGGVRAVHACWDNTHIAVAEQLLGGNTFKDTDQLVSATRSTNKTQLYYSVERLLKGPEVDLAEYDLPMYFDKDGTERHHSRLRWWVEGTNRVVDLVEMQGDAHTPDGEPYPEIPEQLTMDENAPPELSVPVIYGHYWREWTKDDSEFASYQPKEGTDWTKNSACVDFSAVRGGPLVAYRWNDGDTHIRPDRYVAYR